MGFNGLKTAALLAVLTALLVLIGGALGGQGGMVIAFVFAVFTLYGCGAEPVLYGLVMLVLGIPVYVWQRRRAPLANARTM